MMAARREERALFTVWNSTMAMAILEVGFEVIDIGIRRRASIDRGICAYIRQCSYLSSADSSYKHHLQHADYAT